MFSSIQKIGKESFETLHASLLFSKKGQIDQVFNLFKGKHKKINRDPKEEGEGAKPIDFYYLASQEAILDFCEDAVKASKNEEMGSLAVLSFFFYRKDRGSLLLNESHSAVVIYHLEPGMKPE